MSIGRPPRCRRVGFIPEATYFKPAGIPLNTLEEISLTIEEVEAIRLKDLEGMEQEECASKMDISRTTFQRLLRSARHKTAEALLNGKAIRIGGGNFEMSTHRFRCYEGHEWEAPSKSIRERTPEICPVCNTASITVIQLTGHSRCGKAGGYGRRGHVKEVIP